MRKGSLNGPSKTSMIIVQHDLGFLPRLFRLIIWQLAPLSPGHKAIREGGWLGVNHAAPDQVLRVGDMEHRIPNGWPVRARIPLGDSNVDTSEAAAEVHSVPRFAVIRLVDQVEDIVSLHRSAALRSLLLGSH
jgi:hypothetical protein